MKQRAASDVRFRLAMDAMISLDLADKVARAGSPRADREIESDPEKTQILDEEVLNLTALASK